MSFFFFPTFFQWFLLPPNDRGVTRTVLTRRQWSHAIAVPSPCDTKLAHISRDAAHVSYSSRYRAVHAFRSPAHSATKRFGSLILLNRSYGGGNNFERATTIHF